MKIAIVTGNYKGLGKAISEALPAMGYAAPSLVRSADYDLKEADNCKRLVEDTIAKHGRLDLLVNNIGNYIHKNITELSIEEWKEMQDSNLNSAFYMTKFALAHLRKTKGRILNIGYAGVQEWRTYPNTTAYQAAKAGLLVMTRGFAKSEAAHGILVNMLSPGHLENTIAPYNLENIPVGRLAKLEDAVLAAKFLITTDYVTGQNIEVAGGWGL